MGCIPQRCRVANCWGHSFAVGTVRSPNLSQVKPNVRKTVVSQSSYDRRMPISQAIKRRMHTHERKKEVPNSPLARRCCPQALP